MGLVKKLRLRGPEAMTYFELWALVLSSKEAAESVSIYVKGPDTIPMTEFLRLPGIGGIRASRVAAVMELARRFHFNWTESK